MTDNKQAPHCWNAYFPQAVAGLQAGNEVKN